MHSSTRAWLVRKLQSDTSRKLPRPVSGNTLLAFASGEAWRQAPRLMIPRGCGDPREPAGSAVLAGGFTPGIERERSAARTGSSARARGNGTDISGNLLLVFWDQRSVGGRHRGWLSPAARVARGQRKDLFMGEARLHVVFGTGQVGNALAGHLAGLGVAVRAVSGHRPGTLAGGHR